MAAQCAVWLYEHHCFRAEPSIGGAWLRRARRHLEADVDCYAYGSLILREVEVAHGSGELELAEEQARTVIALGRRLQSRDLEAEALQTLGRVRIDQGHAEAGLQLLDEAMLSAHARSSVISCVVLRQAIERWQLLGAPYEVATATLLLGRACRVASDEDEAIRWFAVAESMFGQLGAALDAHTARNLYRPIRLPTGLTEREAEVLRLVASGRTNKEIATELFLSEKTVARHLSNIFTEIDVSSRAAATGFACEHGIAS